MNYRETRNYENLEKRIFDGVGQYGIPQLHPCTFENECEFISFAEVLKTKDRARKGVHFFVDDYRFLRLWMNVDRYLHTLKEFKYVMTPDFSTYTDFPIALQIYNHYRKHWIGAYLQEHGIHIHTDYRDVPEEWLGHDLIESAEQIKKLDEKQYRWVWLEQAIGIDDLIYYMFKKDKHIAASEFGKEEKIEMGEIGIGVDYGQQNPTTYEAFGIDYNRNVFRGLREYYHSGREEGSQKSPSEYAQDLKAFCEKLEEEYDRVVSNIFIDPSAAGLIEEVRRILPYIPVVQAKNDVKLGIGRVQKFLSFEKLMLSNHQTHLIKEMGLYQYDMKSVEHGKEVPIKTNDHCEDALRYLVMGMWHQIKFLLPVTERGMRSDTV